MDVELFAQDPRKRAREAMERIIRNGTDQLAMAFAFCSAAGVTLLLPHVDLLRRPGSFIVVASSPPTDYTALARLHDRIPGNLFVHWGATAPYEIKAGTPLMHSKLIYARSGRECWLWVGSHNLTGNATQGVNSEAAVVLHGTRDEQPFVDALMHVERCRDEATPYDPDWPEPVNARREDILVLHAESDLDLARRLPCRIHLCLDSADHDALLAAPAPLRLFLYPRGSLHDGWQNAMPTAAFAGTVTGLNLTELNPRARGLGATAAWNAADFCIAEQGQVLALIRAGDPGRKVTTQAILSVSQPSDTKETLFSERPRVDTEFIPGRMEWIRVDPDMRRFFRHEHVQGDQMQRSPVQGRNQIIRVTKGDLRPRDVERLRGRLARGRELPIEEAEGRAPLRHPFIVRAKYRLPD